MKSQVKCNFEIEEEGILHWKKSVVIRGVYKPRGAKHGRKPTATTGSSATSMMKDAEELSLDDFYIMADTSSDDDKASGICCAVSNVFEIT